MITITDDKGAQQRAQNMLANCVKRKNNAIAWFVQALQKKEESILKRLPLLDVY